MVTMSNITAVLYTDGNQECERVRMLLGSVEGEVLEYSLDWDFTQREFNAEFGAEATYPQITINGKHVGSLKETLHYLHDLSVF